MPQPSVVVSQQTRYRIISAYQHTEECLRIYVINSFPLQRRRHDNNSAFQSNNLTYAKANYRPSEMRYLGTFRPDSKDLPTAEMSGSRSYSILAVSEWQWRLAARHQRTPPNFTLYVDLFGIVKLIFTSVLLCQSSHIVRNSDK